ncbi:hypothetical protein Tco_1371249 [Tanacetum coccineum]
MDPNRFMSKFVPLIDLVKLTWSLQMIKQPHEEAMQLLLRASLKPWTLTFMIRSCEGEWSRFTGWCGRRIRLEHMLNRGRDAQDEVEKPTVKTNEPETSRKENGAPIIKDWVSDSDEENVPKVKTVEMFNKPSFASMIKLTEKSRERK